jgi:UDP-N-acetylglucosamine 2-epimerase (non-hydrolysing)
MIDSVLRHVERARRGGALVRFGVEPHKYVLATLHRPSNVDDEAQLRGLVAALEQVARNVPVVFPTHPRTRARLAALELSEDSLRERRILACEPLGYLDFLQLEDGALAVVTDSGGVQEETTVLGVPCLTARANTERPITVSQGTNTLIGTNPGAIVAAVAEILAGRQKRGKIPELWDGMAGERGASAIRSFLATAPHT